MVSEIPLELIRPCWNRDSGSQRCRMSRKVISELRIAIGSHLIVQSCGQAVLCKLFVNDENDGNQILCDETVRNMIQHNKSTSTSVEIMVIPQTVSLLKRLTVSVVFGRPTSVREFLPHRSLRTKQIRDILTQFVFLISGCKIDLSHVSPAHLLDLVSVTILHAEPNDPKVLLGRVSTKTELIIMDICSKPVDDVRRKSKRVGNIAGLEEEMNLIKDIAALSLQHASFAQKLGIACPKGILLIGPPGTGKTSLVHMLAQEIGACVIPVSCPSLCRPNPGDSEAALKSVFMYTHELSSEMPCLLLLDEVDSILNSRSKGLSGASTRLAGQLLKSLDQIDRHSGHLLIFGTTNRPEDIDLSARRPGRFDKEVYIGVPSIPKRESILRVICSRLPLHPEVDLKTIAELCPGFVGADLAFLCQQVALNVLSRMDRNRNKDKMDFMIRASDFEEALISFNPSTHRSIFAVSEFKPITWDLIGGLEDIKDKIRQHIEWPLHHPEALTRMSLALPKGLLLYGPPGCCKTSLIRAAACSARVSFISVTAAHIYSPYVGDSERAVVELFRRARLSSPAVLFFDEIESIVGKRQLGDSHRGIHEKVLSAFLNEMDGIGIKSIETSKGNFSDEDNAQENCDDGIVFVVGTTNRPDMLDDAILRPGRFDRILYVPPPDEKARKSILEIRTRIMPMSTDVDLQFLAQKTERFSGADLLDLCREAGFEALRSEGFTVPFIRMSHFLTALEKAEPSLFEEQLMY